MAACLDSLGATVDVVPLHACAGLPAIDIYDGVIPLGGAMNAEDEGRFPFLAETATLLISATRRHIPALDAGALWRHGGDGGELALAGRSDRLFAGFPETPIAFQWHEDAFEPPPGSMLLADSDRDSPQAFSLATSMVCNSIQK